MSDLVEVKLGDLYREAVRLSNLAKADAANAVTALQAGHPASATKALLAASTHAADAAHCMRLLATAFADQQADALEPELT